MIDLQAVKARAAVRRALRADSASLANAAKWLTESPPSRPLISQLARLATATAFAEAQQGAREAVRTPARVARLLRWGWPHAEAQAQAERLRDRDEHSDFRHLCLECRHYRPGRCGNHKAADLLAPAVGKDLATMFQDCPGFVPMEDVR